MSPRKAPEVWCARVATLAFQPKRPMRISPAKSSQTRLTWPLTGPGVAAWRAALARISASGMASIRPTPAICGATRGLIRVSRAIGP